MTKVHEHITINLGRRWLCYGGTWRRCILQGVLQAVSAGACFICSLLVAVCPSFAAQHSFLLLHTQHVLHRHVPLLSARCLLTYLQLRELKLLFFLFFFIVIHKKISLALDGVVCVFIDLVPGTAVTFLSPVCMISARALEQGPALAAAVSPVLTLLV